MSHVDSLGTEVCAERQSFSGAKCRSWTFGKGTGGQCHSTCRDLCIIKIHNECFQLHADALEICVFNFASSRIVSVSTGLEASASGCFQLESLQSSVMGVCFAPMLCVLFLSALDLSTHRHANSGILSLLSCGVGLENWKHLSREACPLDLPRLLQSPHKS